MAELLAATGYNIPTLKSGQEVNGKIVSITHTEILVDIGAKSEGIIFGRELASVTDYTKKLSVGQTLDAVVLYPENDLGQVVLSLRKHSADARWNDLEERKNANEDVEVVALEANRGGLICEFAGIRGFLPASQLATGGKMEDLIGKNIKARVIEVDRTTNRLILSQKVPDKATLEAIVKLLAKVKIGEKYDGIVTAVLPFGLFVEIDLKDESKSPSFATSFAKASKVKKASEGKQRAKETKEEISGISKLEGLVHISEISWEKIDEVTNHFKVGDAVAVAVVDKDVSTGRLSLSIKQLADDPFVKLSGQYSRDQEVVGTVANVTQYGVFVTLDGGIEGLIHVSKIPPNASWQTGQKLDCVIESIDAASHRISLVPIEREKPVLYR